MKNNSNKQSKRPMPRKLPYLIAIVAIPVLGLLIWGMVGLFQSNVSKTIKEQLGVSNLNETKLSDIDYLTIDFHCDTYSIATPSSDGSIKFALSLKQTDDHKSDKYESISATIIGYNKWAKYTTEKKTASLTMSASSYSASNSLTITTAYQSTNGWGINSKVGSPNVYLLLTYKRTTSGDQKAHDESILVSYNFSSYFTSASKFTN